MTVYLDNAATTPLDPEVQEAMVFAMKNLPGNPSSIHSFGRQAKAAIEEDRKKIAKLLNVSPGEIFFTSGGTEADNMAIIGSIEASGIKHAITSEIEHHAVLHTLQLLEKEGKIKLSYVRLKDMGHIDMQHLKDLLEQNERSLVSLMHANNELGNLLPIKNVSDLCGEHDAVFHSDTVQTMAHYQLDFQKVKLHFAACSAHKFHGPKGAGFIYISSNVKIHPLIHGGSQERNMRGGTENIYGIAGLAKAFEIAHRDMEKDSLYIRELKSYMIARLKHAIPDVQFNGDYNNSSLYTVLNVSLPPTKNAEMLLFILDIDGIAASGGSACSSGSNQASHVLKGIGADSKRPAVRFSFSKFNTKEEIDYCIEKLKELNI